MLKITKHSDNKLVLSGSSLDLVKEHFSVANPGKKFNRGRWYIPDRIYKISANGQFGVGMIDEILEFCRDNKIKVSAPSEIKEIIRPGLPKPSASYDLSLTPRDYQQEIVDKCIKYGRGAVILATAGGKTFIMAKLLEYYYKNVNSNFKCLILVPNLGLVNQTHNDFKEYGVSFTHSMMSGKTPRDKTCNVTVANMQILQSKSTDIDWVKDLDVLVVDETHILSHGSKINKVIDKIKTKHRFGFTGTLPNEDLNRWNVLSKVGPKIYDKKAAELRKDGYVTPAEVTVCKLIYDVKSEDIYKPVPIQTPTTKYEQELEFIINNEYRNNFLSTLSNTLKNNTLILVDRIEHGKTIYTSIKKRAVSNKRVYFISGDMEVEERKGIQNLMERENNVVVVAMAKIFSTGINIKNLHNIVFASGGKAQTKIVQSIGRGIRLHENKQMLKIYDIVDNLKYSIDHLKARVKLYNAEKIPYGTRNFTEHNSRRKKTSKEKQLCR